jgi:hypothetical protein
MGRVFFAAALAVSAISLRAGVARAADYPEEYVKRPQVVTQSMLQLKGDMFFNLSNGSAFKPVIIAPSAEFGITDDFQVALRHENSFCFNGCDFYNGFGAEAKYLFLRQDAFSLSGFAGSYINAFDPFLLQARLGVGFWTIAGDQFAVNANLFVGLGITNRSVDTPFGSVTTNPDILVLQVQPAFNFTPQIAGFVNTGFSATFQAFGDTWAIPIGLGAFYTFDKKLDLGGDFMFPRLLAAKNTGGGELRQFDLFVRYRFDFAR